MKLSQSDSGKGTASRLLFPTQSEGTLLSEEAGPESGLNGSDTMRDNITSPSVTITASREARKTGSIGTPKSVLSTAAVSRELHFSPVLSKGLGRSSKENRQFNIASRPDRLER
jgi:hypothetical protein